MESNKMEMKNRSKIENENNHSESDIDSVLNILHGNIYGCDLLLCLFITALQSYRVDTCLRPFPSAYIKDAYKDIEYLRNLCNSIPALDKVLKSPQICSDEIFQFLRWLFCQKDQPGLYKVNLSKVNVPITLKKSFHPHYTYEVIYPLKAEELWQKRKNSRHSFLAYHGSQLDNFYSILKVGLQHHLSGDKTLLYGKGIYVTTEITISMPYAQYGISWQNSKLGDKISIIAVCEVIDDADKVKYDKFKQGAINRGSISNNIPDKYFVITDSDMIRLKYLFVYKENAVTLIESWIVKNLMLILICLYIIILFCIGFFQGPTWPKVQRHLYNILFSDI